MQLYYSDFKKLIRTMIPLWIAQVSTIGMNFMDSAMSGHVSADDLAGVSVGASLFMPILTSSMSVLSAATPMIAQLLGKREMGSIPRIVRTGLYLSMVLACLFALGYYCFIDRIMEGLQLTAKVEYIARYYMLVMVGAFFFETMTIPLRSLTDTVGSTSISMGLFLLALPINGLFNYMFIFGKWGAPAMGGIGAGIATLLTYVFLLALFLLVILRNQLFMGRELFSSISCYGKDWKEYLSLGIPNGLATFMETSLFGFIIIFLTKFGTTVMAAHQAAMNFSALIYVIPFSCSLAMTILVGIEVGANRLDKARAFSRLGLITTLCAAVCTITFTVTMRGWISSLYTEEKEVMALAQLFLLYCAGWQLFDDIAAPIQGILRGYKDAKVPFFLMLLAYWGCCLPMGLFLDFVMGHGALSYWQGLDFGVGCSAVFLVVRLVIIERRMKKEKLGVRSEEWN